MLGSKKFLVNYFDNLFIKRDLSTLDKYLDKNHFDYDIGFSSKDHTANSKQYLSELFIRKPTIRVKVLKTKTIKNVICAQLRWYETINKKEIVWQEGIATFLIQNNKMFYMHTNCFSTI